MAQIDALKDKENDTSSDTRESSQPPPPNNGKLQSAGKKRSRNGCLNCRRKRRKCSETKPTCEGCQSRGEACQWGVKVSFRPENAQTVGKEHHALFRNATTPNRTYQIVDVTSEIARDYIIDGPEPPERLEKIAINPSSNCRPRWMLSASRTLKTCCPCSTSRNRLLGHPSQMACHIWVVIRS